MSMKDWTFKIVEVLYPDGCRFAAWAGFGCDDLINDATIEGRHRLNESEAQSDLETIRAMVRAAELVREGAPTLGDMRNLLFKAHEALPVLNVAPEVLCLLSDIGNAIQAYDAACAKVDGEENNG